MCTLQGGLRHPIHMAILGKNLDLVRWLASERHCPLRSPNGRKALLTSKGRSPLRLALKNLDILRYLVAEMDQSMLEEDLNYRSIVKHLTFLLKSTASPEWVEPRKSDPVDMVIDCRSSDSISTQASF